MVISEACTFFRKLYSEGTSQFLELLSLAKQLVSLDRTARAILLPKVAVEREPSGMLSGQHYRISPGCYAGNRQ